MRQATAATVLLLVACGGSHTRPPPGGTGATCPLDPPPSRCGADLTIDDLTGRQAYAVASRPDGSVLYAFMDQGATDVIEVRLLSPKAALVSSFKLDLPQALRGGTGQVLSLVPVGGCSLTLFLTESESLGTARSWALDVDLSGHLAAVEDLGEGALAAIKAVAPGGGTRMYMSQPLRLGARSYGEGSGFGWQKTSLEIDALVADGGDGLLIAGDLLHVLGPDGAPLESLGPAEAATRVGDELYAVYRKMEGGHFVTHLRTPRGMLDEDLTGDAQDWVALVADGDGTLSLVYDDPLRGILQVRLNLQSGAKDDAAQVRVATRPLEWFGDQGGPGGITLIHDAAGHRILRLDGGCP